MSWVLGIDTSNYTTSAALYNERKDQIIQAKKPLPVGEGAVGLRQSDAVFYHVKQLGMVLEEIFSQAGVSVQAVGVSVRPRDTEGSYMPCFLAGEMAARSIAASGKLPVFSFSHQAGHVMAAVYASGRFAVLEAPFYCFHFSGGTTEVLFISPGDPMKIEIAARSLDLKAGQLIDRVGVLLGLRFPCGPQLEKLALQSERPGKLRPTYKGKDFCLSGLENHLVRMHREGESPSDIARSCIDAVGLAVEESTRQIRNESPDIPIFYAGGVLSNAIIRGRIQGLYGGCFVPPEYASDNGAGIAVLAHRKLLQMKGGE